MFTQLRLENFKSWRALDIKLAPITLLFGVNSSGKSSVLQALLLLKQTLLRYDRSQPLNVGERNIDYVFLGDYSDFIYSHDTSLPLAISLTFKTSESPQQPLFNPSPEEIRYDAEWQLTDSLSRQDHFHPNENWIELEKVLERLAYLAPLRAYPERVYQQRSVAPRRLNRYGENLVDVLLASERRGAQTISSIGEALAQLNLAEAFEIRQVGERLYEARLKIKGHEVSLADVGSGVVQVLPMIALLFAAPEGSILLLEHPDLHLHPSAQAALADIMLEAAEERKLQLIVESHSEHLLTRLQRRIAESERPFVTPENIRAYFCQPNSEGSLIKPVEVNAYGQILNYPPNFFGDLAGDLTATTQAGLRKRREELQKAVDEGSADAI